MTRDALKRQLAVASNPGAIARYMDTCIALYGWEETDRLIREALGVETLGVR